MMMQKIKIGAVTIGQSPRTDITEDAGRFFGDRVELLEFGALRDAISRLSPRERTVIDLRYFHGLTQERVARVIGVSQVQVSRIEKKALAQLRNFI